MTKYFSKINNLDELHQEYKVLAKKLHPDMGGNADEFANMRQEYLKRENEIKHPAQKLKLALKKTVNSKQFDDYVMPSLQKAQKNYAKKLATHKKLLNILSNDKDEQEFYSEILQNALTNVDIRAFLGKILKD